MVSIINKAKIIISKTGTLMAKRIFSFSPKHYFPNEAPPSPSFDHPANFIASLGVKGKYALFVLAVLLFSQLKAQNINIPNKNGPLGTQVNTYTGNLFLSRNELFVPARGIDLDISFYYNTFNYNQNIGFGNGWSFSFGMGYKKDSLGNMILMQGDGRNDIYSIAPNGTYTSKVGFFDTLTQYQSGKYLLQTKYGMQYYFDNSTNKRITKIQDPNGNYLNFAYADSLPTSITNAAGQTITLNYSKGRLSSLVDAMASPTRTYTYTYDGYGNLIQATDPLSNTIKYGYLVNGPLNDITDKNGNSANIIYYPDFTVSEVIGCNSRESFSYDNLNHKTTVTDYLPTSSDQTTTYSYTKYNGQTWLTSIVGNCCGYNMLFDFDNYGNLAKSTNANGNAYYFTYDRKGNMLTMTDPIGHLSTYSYSSDYNRLTSYTDPNGNTYIINYDTKANPVKRTYPNNLIENDAYSSFGDLINVTDANGNTYNFSYDAIGNPTQLSGPLNYAVNMSFNARGNLISLTDPKGNTYNSQYDLLDRLTSITDPLNHQVSLVYDPNGNITSATDPNGHASKVSYDASNRVVTETDALGKTSLFGYDAMNNITTYTDMLGNITTYNYDNRNRLKSAIDALGNTYTFSYDPNGNLTSATYPNGNTITNVYDKLDRPTLTSDLNGTIGSVSYDNNGNAIAYTNGVGATTSATYNGNNRTTKVTDPLGNSKSFGYDNNLNLVSVTDRNNKMSTFVYDKLNRPTSFIDNNGNTVSATYDALNMLTLTDQNNHTTSYTYDALNRKISTIYPNTRSITLGYDNMNNVLTKQMPDGSSLTFTYDFANRLLTKKLPNNNVFSYTYDASGRLTTAVNGTGTETLSYDALNRLATETFNGHTTAYTYNTAGRTNHISYPDGSSITQNFDVRNRLATIVKGNTTIATYKYNNVNQMQQTVYTNGVESDMQYDFANRLNNITTSNGSIQKLAFAYDKEMNKTDVLKSNFPQFTEHYTYDADNRLTGFNQGIVQNTYTYDAVGNRTVANLNGTTTNYTPNNLNQYTNLNNGSQNINFVYDNNGNLTYDGLFYKTYDAEGKLLTDSASPTNKLSYQYDAMGRRVQKTINGKAINYYYAGLAQIEQRDANADTVLNETVFNGPISPVLLAVNHKSYYYHQNDLNSVDAITDSTGNLVESYQYDVYGKPTIYDPNNNVLSTSLANNRFSFTGQEYDAETGSYHFHFRNYSPTTGSFNQRDPIGYGDGTNMYRYAHSNPSNFIDILGLQPCPPYYGTTPSTNLNLPAPNNNLPFQDVWGPNYTGGTGFVANGASNLGGLNAVAPYVPSVQTPQVNGPLAALSLVAYNTSVEDYGYGLGAGTMNSADKAEGGFNLVQGAASLVGSIAALVTGATLAVPAAIGAGSVAVYGGSNFVVTAVTGKSISQNLNSTADDWGAAYYDAAPHNANLGWQMRNGNYDRWLEIEKRNQQKQDEYQRNHPQQPKPTPIVINNDINPLLNVTPISNNPCPPNNNNHGNQNPTPPNPIQTGINIITNNINSQDPNEIIGPTGVGTPQFVNNVAPMGYTINFENSVNASAPAKTIRINYPIDAKQDMNNISLGSFGFNSLTFNVPANTAAYYQRLDARDSLGLYVDITAGLDVNNHQIFWVFQSIDPVTLLTPNDPLKGFLLLTDTGNTASGHGFVNFFVKPVSNAITGDTTHAAATIVFDGNDTVPTNVAKNTIDAGAPTSHMNALPMNSTSTKVPLSWTGADDANGSGVKYYSLYIAVNGGAFGLYATNISRKDTTFTGASGNSYSFFILGTDSVGNTETLKPGAEATTYINAIALPVTWLYFNAVSQGKDGLLTWATATEINTKSFEIERSIDGRNFSTIGTVAAAGNSTAQSNYTYTDKNVVSLNIPVVYYRLKQIDKDGKFTYSNIVAVQLPVVNVGPIVQAYPNPFKQTLNVMIANITALDLSDNIAIYTLEGKIVYEKPIGQRILNTTITLTDLPQLTPGMYVLKLGLNKQTYSFKLMKQ